MPTTDNACTTARVPRLTLKPGAERTLLNGHPWVYSGAVDKAPTQAAPGSVVDVVDHRGRFVTRGFYNPNSLIRVRGLTHNPNQALDQTFIQQALERAIGIRRRAGLASVTDAMRLVHGESDGLPGLVVDDYAGHLVVQFHTHGMERFRATVMEALLAACTPVSVYERSDVGTRRAEGLSDRPTGLLAGERLSGTVWIREHGVSLAVDLINGQKTGFFLDQRPNRALLQALARDQSVLNCFAYTSAFSAHAIHGGARQTLDLDIVPQVARLARTNLHANGGEPTRCRYVVADVLPFLDELCRRGPRFDVVVLDPPSLLRKQEQLKRAMGVYTMINRNALRLVHAGGLLVTSSCSSRVSAEDFFQIVRRAAIGAHVQLRITDFTQHAPDHPVDPAFPEGRYLKTIFARVYR